MCSPMLTALSNCPTICANKGETSVAIKAIGADFTAEDAEGR
jgi:hypothetical protein